MSWLLDEAVKWETGSVITYSIITTFITLTLVWYFKRQQKVWLLEQIPGPRGLPIIGNALFFNADSSELFKRFLAVAEKGEVTRLWLGSTGTCLLSSARTAEVILSSTKHLDKSEDYTLLHPWLGKSLLTSAGSHWHARRKLLTPAFHFKILEQFIEVFNRQINKMVHKLLKKADGSPFDISDDITHCVLDIICETAMGRSINAQDNSESEYVQAVRRISGLIQYRQFRPWMYNDFLFKLLGPIKEYNACLKTLHDMSNSTIKERKASRKDKANTEVLEEEEVFGKKKRQAFLDLMLEYAEENPELTDEEIRKEVDTFMFAGHDTTASAINWVLYCLGLHPDIQTRVQEELDDIFGGSDRPATMDDLRQMKYAEMCIKESLRIFPPVPVISRDIKEEIVINNYRIPAKTIVAAVIYKIHRDPEQFPDPEVFDPDRFLAENATKRHPYAYVPFSAGPRNCIGQKFAMLELKTVVSSIFRKLRVESVVPRKDLKITAEIILRPANGNILKLSPRTK
ncbi:cytochrome P450 4C1 [Procambarus clarkii]|uniref:cytochrome P450 4C1 n=1 Tax=Procambarus clarkii TaxID=6728 RepID=UPI003743C137